MPHHPASSFCPYHTSQPSLACRSLPRTSVHMPSCQKCIHRVPVHFSCSAKTPDESGPLPRSSRRRVWTERTPAALPFTFQLPFPSALELNFQLPFQLELPFGLFGWKTAEPEDAPLLEISEADAAAICWAQDWESLGIALAGCLPAEPTQTRIPSRITVAILQRICTFILDAPQGTFSSPDDRAGCMAVLQLLSINLYGQAESMDSFTASAFLAVLGLVVTRYHIRPDVVPMEVLSMAQMLSQQLRWRGGAALTAVQAAAALRGVVLMEVFDAVHLCNEVEAVGAPLLLEAPLEVTAAILQSFLQVYRTKEWEPSQAWLEAAAWTSVSQLPQARPAALASLIHGLSHLKAQLDPDWIICFDYEFQKRQDEFTPADIATVLVSYQELRYTPARYRYGLAAAGQEPISGVDEAGRGISSNGNNSNNSKASRHMTSASGLAVHSDQRQYEEPASDEEYYRGPAWSRKPPQEIVVGILDRILESFVLPAPTRQAVDMSHVPLGTAGTLHGDISVNTAGAVAERSSDPRPVEVADASSAFCGVAEAAGPAVHSELPAGAIRSARSLSQKPFPDDRAVAPSSDTRSPPWAATGVGKQGFQAEESEVLLSSGSSQQQQHAEEKQQAHIATALAAAASSGGCLHPVDVQALLQQQAAEGQQARWRQQAHVQQQEEEEQQQHQQQQQQGHEGWGQEQPGDVQQQQQARAAAALAAATSLLGPLPRPALGSPVLGGSGPQQALLLRRLFIPPVPLVPQSKQQ